MAPAPVARSAPRTEQVPGLPGRDHLSSDEPGVRGGHHQHRRQRCSAGLKGDPARREPEIALRSLTRSTGRCSGRNRFTFSLTTGSSPYSPPVRPAPSPACPVPDPTAPALGARGPRKTSAGLRSQRGGLSLRVHRRATSRPWWRDLGSLGSAPHWPVMHNDRLGEALTTEWYQRANA